MIVVPQSPGPGSVVRPPRRALRCSADPSHAAQQRREPEPRARGHRRTGRRCPRGARSGPADHARAPAVRPYARRCPTASAPASRAGVPTRSSAATSGPSPRATTTRSTRSSAATSRSAGAPPRPRARSSSSAASTRTRTPGRAGATTPASSAPARSCSPRPARTSRPCRSAPAATTKETRPGRHEAYRRSKDHASTPYDDAPVPHAQFFDGGRDLLAEGDAVYVRGTEPGTEDWLATARRSFPVLGRNGDKTVSLRDPPV